MNKLLIYELLLKNHASKILKNKISLNNFPTTRGRRALLAMVFQKKKKKHFKNIFFKKDTSFPKLILNIIGKFKTLLFGNLTEVFKNIIYYKF